ncbi:MAG: hypothetical protein ACFE0I_05610 [Elainellaceae cyanobacterium]
MTTQYKRFLSLGIGFGVLAFASQTQIPTMMADNSAQLVLNGLTMNGLSMNGLSMNGQDVNRSTSLRPDWINPATTEARLNHQMVESVSLNGGQLTFQLSD